METRSLALIPKHTAKCQVPTRWGNQLNGNAYTLHYT